MVDDEHLARRRKEIMESAVDLFDRQGFASTTMDDVAAGAGISKGSIYNYFESKSDLFDQLFAAAIAPDEVDVERLFARPAPAAEKIEGYLDFWFERLEHYERVGRLTLEFWATAARAGRHGDLAEMLQGVYNRWEDRLAGAIADGIARGEFDTPLAPTALAALIHGMMDGLLLHTILKIGVAMDSQLLSAMKGSVLAALGVRAAAGPDEAGKECDDE